MPRIDAKDQLPWLMSILKTQDQLLSMQASNAVWRIAPELLTHASAQ